jgi:hypothetical protein
MNSKPIYETWNAGNSQTFLYTEDSALAPYILSEVGKRTSYQLNGRIFAWQFLLRNDLVSRLVRKYSETHPLKNNDLQTAV